MVTTGEDEGGGEMAEEGFYTLKGYSGNNDGCMTSAMEDYLEMIFRLGGGDRGVRVGEISKSLHVRPSSATKMIVRLTEGGYIKSERYGTVSMTEKGISVGRYLIYRHEVVYRFLQRLNGDEGQLEEAEKIEHFLSSKTVENLARLTSRMGDGGE